MRHLHQITQKSPACAASWQDGVCFFMSGLATLLGFIGGTAPLVLFIEDKCAIPQANDTDGASG